MTADAAPSGVPALVACPRPGDRPCGCPDESFVELRLTTDDLGAVRFAAHPVWETVASLCVISHPQRHSLHRRLLDLVARPTYDLELLTDLLSHPRWYPGFLCPEPVRPTLAPEAALAAVPGTDLELARRDLEVLRELHPGNPRWAAMGVDRLLTETTAALLGYWRQVLRPMWERISEIVEADLAYRSRSVTAMGLAGALTDLHDDLAYRGDHVRIRLAGHHRHLRTRGQGVWFVPTVFRWPRIVVEIDNPTPIVGYAARGAGRIWESTVSPPSRALRDILGHSRVDILRCLDVPTTTTRLARRLDLSPGTVSTHVNAMARAGLLQPHRRGREVLYRRTELGDRLADASPEAGFT